MSFDEIFGIGKLESLGYRVAAEFLRVDGVR